MDTELLHLEVAETIAAAQPEGADLAFEAAPLAGTAEAPVFSRPEDWPEERVDVTLRRVVKLEGFSLSPKQAHRMAKSFALALGDDVLRMEPVKDGE